MIAGMNDQASSSGNDPSMRAPTSPSCRRRYLMPNSTMKNTTAKAKNAQVATMKKYSASTSLAIDEACSGNSGIPFISSVSGRRARLAPQRHHDKSDQRHQRQGAAQPHRVHGGHAVAPRLRLVVVAVEQHLVHHRPDPAFRRLHQRE